MNLTPILMKYVALSQAAKPHRNLNFAVPPLKCYPNSVEIVSPPTAISNRLNFPLSTENFGNILSILIE